MSSGAAALTLLAGLILVLGPRTDRESVPMALALDLLVLVFGLSCIASGARLLGLL